MNQENVKMELKTSRIEALSDGIFAIAMTILVLSFEPIFNQPTTGNERYLIRSLMKLWPDFVHYVESFIILGVFWYQHHRQFHFIRSVDKAMLFINIAALMFIGLIPFSTVILGDYSNTRTAALLFEFNLLIAGLIFFAHWAYSTHKRRFVNADLKQDVIEFYKKRNLLIPAVSLCAIFVSLILPKLGVMLYFLVPVILLVWRRKDAAEG